MRNFNNSTIGNSVRISKTLKMVAAVLVVYGVLRLILFTALFNGVGDVVGAFVIAVICVYFAGRCCCVQHEREVEAEDEAMLEEAPVLAQPTPVAPVVQPSQAATAVTTNTDSQEETAPEPKKFVAPSYKNYQSIVDAQGLTDDEKIAIMEQSKIVNEQQQAINDARRERNQAVADYNATFGRRFVTTPPVPTMTKPSQATQTTQSAQPAQAAQTTNP